MDAWPQHALQSGGTLIATTVLAFWVALALTRRRFEA
jgi:lipooligosaccharide transport system permease protein